MSFAQIVSFAQIMTLCTASSQPETLEVDATYVRDVCTVSCVLLFAQRSCVFDLRRIEVEKKK